MDLKVKQIKPMSCPVCDRMYFSKLNEDLIEQLGLTPNKTQCTVCGWFYDLEQTNDPDLKNQANEMSLNEYREWYKNKIAEDPKWEYYKDFIGDPEPHWCPLCGEHLFPDTLSYEICPVCGWEDNGDETDRDKQNYPTAMSFNQRKEWFENQRKLDPKFKAHPERRRRLKVRKRRPND